MKKISVIIPVYNTEKYLPRAINSILESSIINDIEIIVVDDASFGNCKEIVQKYNKNIKYIRHKNNEGLFRTRLTGIKNASGEYIAHLDSDDYVINDIYKKAYEYAKEYKQEVVMFNMQNLNDENKNWINRGEKIYSFRDKRGLDLIKEIFYANTFNWTIHACWNKIVKKNVLDNLIEPFQNIKHLNLSEDLLWNTAIFLELKNANKISSIDEIGINYYIHNNSITKKYSKKSFIKNINDIEYCYSEIKKLFNMYYVDDIMFYFLLRTKIYVLKIQFKHFPLYYSLITPYSFLKLQLTIILNRNIDDLVETFLLNMILKKTDNISDIKEVYIYGNNKLSKEIAIALKYKKINVISYIVTKVNKNSKQKNTIEVNTLRNSKIDTMIISSMASFYEIKEILKINNIYINNIISVY